MSKVKSFSDIIFFCRFYVILYIILVAFFKNILGHQVPRPK